MPLSFVQYTGDGSQTIFTFSFGYLSKDHLAVKVDGTPVSFTLTGPFEVTTDVPPANGTTVEISRTTPSATLLTDFQDGSTVGEKDLDNSSLQMLYIAQESQDTAQTALNFGSLGYYDAQNKQIKNVAAPTDGGDAINKTYHDDVFLPQLQAEKTAAEAAAAAAATSETNAVVSETNAGNSETAAATSETNAAASESAAATSATNAAASATAAQTAETNAETAETNAEAAQTATETALSDALALYGGLSAVQTAVSDAQDAQAAAETAETNAETAETNAASSASSASTSATNAGNSASAAAGSATAAGNSASTASSAATSASNSASSASTSSTNAGNSASAAAASATNAANSETAAATSESSASDSEANAAASETAAAGSASSASISATNAGNSATAAASSASSASASASNAATSETNAAASEIVATASAIEAASQAARLVGTSTTSLTIGTGTKVFTTQSGKQFNVGQFVLAVSDGDPANNRMSGQITGYTGTSLTVDMLESNGSGTHTDWTIFVAGPIGPQGFQGPPGDLGSAILNDLSDVTITTPSTGQVLRKSAGDWINATLDYSDLSGTPSLAAVAASGDYDDLINTPSLATVAASGDYNDLINTPSLGALAALSTVGTSEITNDAVTFAKIQNITTARILGRNTAGTGDTEQLTAATVRTMLNVADGATANSSDATLLNRANHTGTQLMSTISNAGALATLSTVNNSNWSGTDLSVSNGGTGVSTLTGIVKGNGASAFSAAAAGTDYVAPGTATNFTAQQYFGEADKGSASSSISWNLTTEQNATVSLGLSSHTLSNPTNMQAGLSGNMLIVLNDSPVSLSFGSAYLFPGGTAPDISSASSGEAFVLSYYCDGNVMYCALGGPFIID